MFTTLTQKLTAALIVCLCAGWFSTHLRFVAMREKVNLMIQQEQKTTIETQRQRSQILQAHAQEIEALSRKVTQAQRGYTDEREKIVAVERRLAAERVRHASTVANLDRKIGEASHAAVSQYAKAISGDLERHREHIARLGFEAAECSAAAQTLSAALDALEGPRRP